MQPLGWERRRIDYVRGIGAMVLRNERISVQCELEVFREYQDGYPFRSEIVGRVWKPGDPYFAHRYVGKECILEAKGRRLSMFITDENGTIGPSGGIVEGFADLKG